METIRTRCCIAGGGPAGIMLGYVLARAGIDVVVLEKWPDFFRDFRGDTIHPSTMETLHELGLLEKFLKLPHQKTRQMVGTIGGEEVVIADFSYLSAREPYIAFIPQWEFLNFLSAEAQQFSNFKILMHTEAIHLIEEGNRVVGVTALGPTGPIEIRAELVVGADGRHSTIREKSGLVVKESGVPIDVLWFKLPSHGPDPQRSLAFLDGGKALVALDRGEYWQCGYLIPKGKFDDIRASGIERFRIAIAALAPFLSPSVNQLTNWEQVKLLSVTIDHLETWYKNGLVCIGDASHAMSPMGGVGINLALQDAVAAATILIPAFKKGTPTVADCAAIQRRREFPTRVVQRMQVFLQDRFFNPYLHSNKHIQMPFILRLFQLVPLLRAIPGYIIGVGVRPEHISADLLK